MKYYHPLLLTPGPTPVPEQILHATQLPMVGHRSSDFESIAEEAFRALKPIFGAKNDVIILTSSGTSSLEASMLNLANPEDDIVIIVSGAFGNRFKQIAESYYENVHIFEVEWGKAVNVPDFIDFLKSLNRQVTAVYSQYCETSTAVLHPVNELGHALKNYDPSIFYVVDGVSCIGAVDVDLERDQIDVLISGSQKAIMLPPGLAFVAYNDRAKARFAEVTTPRFYLDLNKYLKSQAEHSTPFTPNVSLFRGVNAYAQLVNEEGFEQVIRRHYAIRDALRQALTALDLNLLVDEAYASPTVTAFIPNSKEELNYIKTELKKRFAITIAGGQGHLKGEILRIGHMGQISPFDILQVVSALEILLTEYRNQSYIGTAITQYTEVIKAYV
ncbi:alanine--glyoxylate aminotransferase family protein [Staphylococcus saprophyticus]|uniref:Putative aminotransferase n=1 Tax=Staphylococcus saprophyticus subsp. saprophyticus (strain ATCC 15305 / DSM 20229 / NCIMB 8711 / NCTC 7292 / S-41) TaxID=342451 RepID=Q49YF6_STAS1|nr:alanine--glyoxylate aminotransferase family protein [Staphylococcus saprophyticus]CRV15659.1 Soluble hydrogenase 42 kDa subunit [Streptococcus equi subsp. equi]ASF17908.1 alanine--glyoxylate aminotransferase family protein [Staphylococcus saprophyticus]MBN6849545.1 alanine--glyoxylate aminotransferase family protein [Staphylococcus saprophyticus]MBU8679203.1 alanine--glyoxylate aminotransferase family protein [Staphylococcus saprophyticus]MDW3801295.1 alanine--glyoxylate aminotransferase fa